MPSHPTKSVEKVVLAYSGGLDTSVIVPWLKENYGCEVVCFTADVGQADELEGLEEKALASGASQLIIKDLNEEFASDYLIPLVRSGAIYERKYLLGTSVARPLLPNTWSKWSIKSAPMPSPTALRAKATTRYASNSPSWRSTRG